MDSSQPPAAMNSNPHPYAASERGTHPSRPAASLDPHGESPQQPARGFIIRLHQASLGQVLLGSPPAPSDICQPHWKTLPACSACCFSILSVRYLWVHKLILFHYRWEKHGKTDRDLGELMHHNPHLKLYPQSFMKGPSLTCGVGSPSCPKIPKNETVAGSN